ncbi:MAG: formate dehydrogenase major subunit, partial [Actinomycetota bacterium]|nr:formate dehydrogenase major subunit [Actinomycetota bacterium]
MGTSFGRGGATTFQQDLQNSDCILIMGSNMAECHPVGFQWVMEARERGARVIHVDPRYSRTSAVSTDHVRIRAGSDIAFLGGIVNYILENERWFDEYVKHFTNAPVIVDERFQDTEDLDGLFSGFDPDKRIYDTSTWHYAGMPEQETAGERSKGGTKGEQSGHGAQAGHMSGGEP